MEHMTSDEQFKQVIAQGTVIASFSAPWCGSCKMLKPKVEKLAQELTQAKFVKLDAEELEELVDELEVENFPHFRAYKDGQLVGQYTGSKFEKVEEFIRAHV